ncbi:MAG: inositol monophosphatase family protein [Granulosicoccaceae bacterium]
METALQQRHDTALEIVQHASVTAHNYFRDIDKLVIEQKGKQDLVSDADKGVELQIRAALQENFPGDGIIGEEHGRIASESGYTWVIDPIDGTTSFVSGMPGWCVVLACVKSDETVLGIIIDPIAQETYIGIKSEGATINGRTLQVSKSQSFADGSTAVGYSMRAGIDPTLQALKAIMDAGGVFYRCGSGALMLCYVAAGRLVGYCEPHMNAWDCIAALLIISEAGGELDPFDMSTMLDEGGSVITACPGVYPELLKICKQALYS